MEGRLLWKITIFTCFLEVLAVAFLFLPLDCQRSKSAEAIETSDAVFVHLSDRKTYVLIKRHVFEEAFGKDNLSQLFYACLSWRDAKTGKMTLRKVGYRKPLCLGSMALLPMPVERGMASYSMCSLKSKVAFNCVVSSVRHTVVLKNKISISTVPYAIMPDGTLEWHVHRDPK